MGKILGSIAVLIIAGLAEASIWINHSMSDPQKLTATAFVFGAAFVVIAIICADD